MLGVDDLVQNVVSTIQQQGELKNTVLMFTSDNGFFHGEHRVPQGKVRLYEPSIRVPLLIRAPGMPKGVHRSQPVGNVDLTETILDFANAKPGRKEDGMSLVPIMEKKRYWPGRAMDLETFFTPDALEDPEDPPLNYQGVRTDRYLYANYGSGEQELYDLRNDPFELQNAASNPAYAQVKGSLQVLLSGLANCAGRTCRVQPALKLKARNCSEAPGDRQGAAPGGHVLPARQEDRKRCEAPDPDRSAQRLLRREAGGGGELARRAEGQPDAEAPGLLRISSGARPATGADEAASRARLADRRRSPRRTASRESAPRR